MIKRDPHPANQEEEKYHGYWGEVHTYDVGPR